MSLKKQLLQKAITFSAKGMWNYCIWAVTQIKKNLALALIRPYSGQLNLIWRLHWLQRGKIKAQTGCDSGFELSLSCLSRRGLRKGAKQAVAGDAHGRAACGQGAAFVTPLHPGFIDSCVAHLLHPGSAPREGDRDAALLKFRKNVGAGWCDPVFAIWAQRRVTTRCCYATAECRRQ